MPPEIIKVVVCCNYTLIRSTICQVLCRQDDIVILGEAGDGNQLMEILENREPEFLILDFRLPRPDGIDLFPIIKQKHPSVKVIIFSLVDDADLVRQLMEMGANSYLGMQNGFEQIYEAIRICRAKGYYINDLIRYSLAGVKPPELPVTFSEKEKTVLRLLKDKKTSAEISGEVNLMKLTVEAMIDRLKFKTKSGSIEELLAFSKENNLIE